MRLFRCVPGFCFCLFRFALPGMLRFVGLFAGDLRLVMGLLALPIDRTLNVVDNLIRYTVALIGSLMKPFTRAFGHIFGGIRRLIGFLMTPVSRLVGLLVALLRSSLSLGSSFRILCPLPRTFTLAGACQTLNFFFT
jgi:hypothetical protein